jgi:hypothetical protein
MRDEICTSRRPGGFFKAVSVVSVGPDDAHAGVLVALR